MSQPSTQSSQIAAVEAALAAAFGGAIPAVVDAMVDRVECAKLTQNSYLSWTFPGGGDGAYVRVATLEDGGALAARVCARWPAARAWFDRWPGGHVKVELDGSDDLRLFFFQIDVGSAGAVPAGMMAVGGVVQLSEGRFLPYTMHSTPPVVSLPAVIAGPVEAALAAGCQGMWFVRWRDGAAISCAVNAENPYTPETAAYIQGLGGPPAQHATREALEGAGLQIHPWGAEWFADGRVEITFWGLRDRPQESWLAPEIFLPGRAPATDAFVEGCVQFLATADQDAGRALVRDHLVPSLAATVPAGSDPAAWFRAAWDGLHERMSGAHPAQRAGAFRVACEAAQLVAWDADAFRLSLARYLRSHPDTPVPGDAELPPEIRDLPAGDVKERAEALLARVQALVASIGAVPDAARWMLTGLVPQAENTIDMLQRAVSGDFTAAIGRLHEWLQELGPGAYDDDPALAGIEDVDLEAAASHAAIEEALARGED